MMRDAGDQLRIKNELSDLLPWICLVYCSNFEKRSIRIRMHKRNPIYRMK